MKQKTNTLLRLERHKWTLNLSLKANTALHETMALDLAVKTAFEMTDSKETLIIVTADHGHTMTMAGYQSRGADIRGKR